MSDNVLDDEGQDVPGALSSSTDYCNETIHADPPEPFQVTFFQNPERITRVHRNTPRFGMPKDINRLLLENFEEEGSDYVVGVVSSSIAIAVTVAVWFVILLVLRCLGPDRVGMFSGKLPQQDRRKAEAPTAQTPRLPPNKQQGEQRRNNKSEHDASELPPDVIAALSPATLVTEASAEPNANDNQKPSKRNKKSKKDVSGLPSDVISALAETTLVSDRSVEMQRDPAREGSSGRLLATPARRLKSARTVVLLCGVGIAICMILLCSLGVPSLVDALNSGQSALRQGEDLALEGAELIETFLARTNVTQNGVQTYADGSTEICPLLVEHYCMAFFDGCNSDVIQESLNEFVIGAEILMVNALHDARDDLLKIAEELDNFYNVVNSFWWAFSVAFAFAILQATLAIAVSYGVVLASKNGDQRRKGCRHTMLRILHSWLFVPAFALVSFLSFVFTLVFVLGSIGTADFCFDSPDPKILAVLEDNRDFFSSSVYELTRFYVGGCPKGTLPPSIDQASAFALDITTVITDLTGALAGLTDADYFDVCGVEKVGLAIYTVEAATCLMAASAVDIQNIFQCGRWRPLYTAVFYDALCYQGHKGLYFVCVTQFLVVLFAMTMLTFRASFLSAPSESSENAHEEVAAPAEPSESFAPPPPTEKVVVKRSAAQPKKPRENEGQDPSAFLPHRGRNDQPLPTADPPVFFPHWDEGGFSHISGTTTGALAGVR